LNRVAFVAQAVESVLRQDYPAVEHIIMDAGSSDGTLELLHSFPHLRVHSEPDEGIYDGLNRGVRIARGDIIGFLNTDDLYEPDVFRSVAQAFEAAPEIDAVVGGASIFREDRGGDQAVMASFPCVAPGELLMRATEGAPIFNAWFFRRRFLEEFGGLDTHYLYAADRDLLIRMAFRDASYAGLNRPVYRYRMHPGSYTLSGQDSGEDPFMFETRALAERYVRLSGLRPEARKCLRRWHSKITLEHIWTAWRRRAFGRMFGYMLVGLRHNVAWPWLFAGKAIDRLIRHESP